MNRRILFLQFRTDQSESHELELMDKNLSEWWGDVEVVNLIRTPEAASRLVNRLDDFSCVVIGGSGESDLSKYGKDEKLTAVVDAVKPLLQKLIDTDKPTFGICLGLGLVAWVLGAKILNGESQRGELGSVDIRKLDEANKDELFGFLPEHFVGQQGHKEAVGNLPDGAKLLLTNDVCPIQAMKYKNNIYGVQFHPELTKMDWIDRAGLYETNHEEYGYDTKHDELKNNLKESPEALDLLRRFLEIYSFD